MLVIGNFVGPRNSELRETGIGLINDGFGFGCLQTLGSSLLKNTHPATRH
jgi:hypothetical protein